MRVISVLALTTILCVCADTAFAQYYYSTDCVQPVTVIREVKEVVKEVCPPPACPAEKCGGWEREVGWEFTGAFRFSRKTDFSINNLNVAAMKKACEPASFKIELCGDASTIMLLEGEKVTLVAEATLDFPPEYVECLNKIHCPCLYEPIRVRMDSVLDGEGIAKFNCAEFFAKAIGGIQKAGILKSQALLGLQEVEVTVSGVARAHEKLFKSCNTLDFTANVN